MAAAAKSSAYESILVLHNVAKKRNFGELMRTAAAMGVAEIVVVGARKLASHGAQGTQSHVRFSHLGTFDEAVAYLKGPRGATLCGVEIAPHAASVASHPFKGTTAFLMGNEGDGLSAAHLAACDQLVYIPQHSTATASLNVNAACAVVLHHFATWAQLPEAPISNANDAKYAVAEMMPSAVPRSGIGLNQMRTLDAAGGIVPKGRGGGGGGGDDGGGADSGAWEAAAFGEAEAEAEGGKVKGDDAHGHAGGADGVAS